MKNFLCIMRRMLILACLFAMTSGCGAANTVFDSGISQTNSKTKGEEDMEKTEMTALEVELFCKVYQDTNRICEGRLFDHQEEALRQLRTGMAYLEEKYPGQTLKVLSFEPANKFNGRAEILFHSDDTEDYTVYVEPTDEKYLCTDTYYGRYLRVSYDKRVQDVLAQGGYTGMAYSRFPVPAGMEIGIETTVDDLLRIQPKLTRTTDLFLAADDKEQVAAEVQSLLTDAGLYGVYILYFVPKLQENLTDLDEKRTQFRRMTFQCFDIF